MSWTSVYVHILKSYIDEFRQVVDRVGEEKPKTLTP